MATIPPDKVLTERVFVSQDKMGVNNEVKLILAKPEHIDQYRWRCSFQIQGIGHEKIRTADGVDLLDALLMSLRMADMLLEYFSQHAGKTITWLGKDDLGLITGENDQ